VDPNLNHPILRCPTLPHKLFTEQNNAEKTTAGQDASGLKKETEKGTNVSNVPGKKEKKTPKESAEKKQKKPKEKKLAGLPKLDDANEAGGPRSSECTLILTEGDSAKVLAVCGLSVVGRDLYGVYPLRHVPSIYLLPT
jgi:DNA topoisomerase-2